MLEDEISAGADRCEECCDKQTEVEHRRASRGSPILCYLRTELHLSGFAVPRAQPRRTQQRPARVPRDEPALIARLIALARRFGRYGSRRITALLRAEGWRVNHKRVERRWRQEGLRVPRKAPHQRRLWATAGSCTRRRAERPNHVWSYDCVHERTQDGRPRCLLGFVGTYRTLCMAPEPGFRRILEGVRHLTVAA